MLAVVARVHTDATTLIYTDLVLLGAGAGAIALGIHLRRKRRAAPHTSPPTDPKAQQSWRTNQVLDAASPYFLMLWGTGFFAGGAVLAASLIRTAAGY
jgi:hypothetical protein